MNKLEQDILDIINEVIEGKYIGKLKVIFEDGVWQLHLFLDRNYTPVTLAYEGDFDEFKKFVKREIKKNKYEKIKFWKITREPIIFDDKKDE